MKTNNIVTCIHCNGELDKDEAIEINDTEEFLCDTCFMYEYNFNMDNGEITEKTKQEKQEEHDYQNKRFNKI